MIEQFWN